MPVISKEYVSILAALPGGLLGVFGGSWVQNYLDEAASYREEHSTLAQEHIYGFLFQRHYSIKVTFGGMYEDFLSFQMNLNLNPGARTGGLIQCFYLWKK